MKNKKFPFFKYDVDGLFDELQNNMSSMSIAHCHTAPIAITKPSDATVEEQLDYMVAEYNKLVKDFHHLYSVVADLQEIVRHLMYHCEYRFDDVEHELSRHCSGFYSRLIITDKRKDKKDESDIS